MLRGGKLHKSPNSLCCFHPGNAVGYWPHRSQDYSFKSQIRSYHPTAPIIKSKLPLMPSRTYMFCPSPSLTSSLSFLFLIHCARVKSEQNLTLRYILWADASGLLVIPQASSLEIWSCPLSHSISEYKCYKTRDFVYLFQSFHPQHLEIVHSHIIIPRHIFI